MRNGDGEMLGDYRETMDLWLLQVKHRYDEEYEVVGIFETESDVMVAENLYLQNKEEAGLNRDEFTFSKSKYELGNIEY